MAHEILAVKLCELEDQMARLLSRIRLCETADKLQLKQEIRALRRECTEDELTLQKKLQLSRAEIVSDMAQIYEQIEEIIRQYGDHIQVRLSGAGDDEVQSEERILLAEYALDFAMQAANRALLHAMEAVDAQSKLR